MLMGMHFNNLFDLDEATGAATQPLGVFEVV